ncbi:hypothetical protein RGQ29_017158 [Quercus rubra]|uniref:Uncharacterized protein n=1 Tax=Quercus rubra TaxID=3512 RepID=A0AAN7IXC0_QUERU|nr:hypothetical protein RGQ29_017158 [Quercus rubra]
MMASTCNRVIGRTFLSSLKSTVKPRLRPSTTSFRSSTSSTTPSTRRFSPFTRNLVSELGGIQSLMPLHSAMATARMTSCLSLDGSSRALSQDGIDGT